MIATVPYGKTKRSWWVWMKVRIRYVLSKQKEQVLFDGISAHTREKGSEDTNAV